MEELTPYIERYHTRWLSCVRYYCSIYGCWSQADDLMGDVMLELCCKPQAMLDDMLQHELRGEPKLKNYVRKIIRFRAMDINKHQVKSISIENIPLSYATSDDEQPQMPDQMREFTATLREDSFITPTNTKPIQGVKGYVSQCVRKTGVYYAAGLEAKPKPIRRNFTTRHAAFGFLMSMAGQL